MAKSNLTLESVAAENAELKSMMLQILGKLGGDAEPKAETNGSAPKSEPKAKRNRSNDAAVDAENVEFPEYAQHSEFWFAVSKMGSSWNPTDNLVGITGGERRFARSMEMAYKGIEDSDARERLAARGDSRVNGPTPKMLTSQYAVSILNKCRPLYEGGHGEATDVPATTAKPTRQARQTVKPTTVAAQTPANGAAVRKPTNTDSRQWHEHLSKDRPYFTKDFAKLAASIGVTRQDGTPVGANGMIVGSTLDYLRNAVPKPKGPRAAVASK